MRNFEESQYFRNVRWMWFVLVGVFVLETAVLGTGLYQQLVLGRPFGQNPLSNGGLIIAGALGTGITLLAAVLMYHMRLSVRVNEQALEVEFFPLRSRRIERTQIRSAEARTYRPMAEFLGWGWKWGPGGWCYSVYGDRGVQVTLTDGKTFLVGSQHAEELAAAILRRDP